MGRQVVARVGGLDDPRRRVGGVRAPLAEQQRKGEQQRRSLEKPHHASVVTTGNVTTNTAPPPSAVCTDTSPPWARAMCLTSARPIPDPLATPARAVLPR